jgi:dipeptidyl-peptidase-3
MVRAGLVALEQYDPESKTWGQAHMRARYAILRVLLADGGGCTAVTRTGTRGGADEDVTVSIDRARLDAARDAIGQYLVRLQTHKSTGDGAGGRAMFEALTTVPADWVELREIVLRRKKPRSVFVQPHLETDKDGSVKYVEFPATPVGVIESFQHRFPPGTAEDILAKHMEAI